MQDQHHEHHLHQSLSDFTFFELWNPSMFILVVIIGFIYMVGITRLRHIFVGEQALNESVVSIGKRISFFTGLAVLFIALGSPLDVLGHSYSFTAHMTQMALLFMVVPPFIILGTPLWFYEYFRSKERVMKILKPIANPLVALFTFNLLFSVYHLPIVFDTVMANHLLHEVYHLVLFCSAFFMWWPIISPIPDNSQLSAVKKMGYIITGSVLITPVCALVIFADTVLYRTYLEAPQLFTRLGSLDDQQLGGVLMKVIQEISYGIALGITFFSWVKRDRKQHSIDPISEEDMLLEEETKRLITNSVTGEQKNEQQGRLAFKDR